MGYGVDNFQTETFIILLAYKSFESAKNNDEI